LAEEVIHITQFVS